MSRLVKSATGVRGVVSVPEQPADLLGDIPTLTSVRRGSMVSDCLHAREPGHSLGNGDGQRPNVGQIRLLQGIEPDYHRSEGYGHPSTSRYFQLSAGAVPLS